MLHKLGGTNQETHKKYDNASSFTSKVKKKDEKKNTASALL